MFVGQFRHFTPARGTLQKAFFYEERFINFFDSACIFTQSCSNGCQTYRTAFELINDGTKYFIVYLIQIYSNSVSGRELITVCGNSLDTE